ncbi:hypothetical protein HU200_011141 [Digitaria exilis]|uniref:Uncharacterized protein n=1 Tax=Digitaria exilis TaxID=1010633 RepID=A0A835KMX9_9POAL|nr:hypothetical protein HU200_011141 [Digitaria exilis]
MKKMRKAKRRGSDLTRSFRKNRRDCKTDWVSGLLVLPLSGSGPTHLRIPPVHIACHLYCVRLGKVDQFFLLMGNFWHEPFFGYGKNHFLTMEHNCQASGVLLDIAAKGDRSCTVRKYEGLLTAYVCDNLDHLLLFLILSGTCALLFSVFTFNISLFLWDLNKNICCPKEEFALNLLRANFSLKLDVDEWFGAM